jgi:hypothetical protein
MRILSGLRQGAANLRNPILTELTKHADDAIRFLRDMFSARLYRLAETKVRALDYKDLVD